MILLAGGGFALAGLFFAYAFRLYWSHLNRREEWADWVAPAAQNNRRDSRLTALVQALARLGRPLVERFPGEHKKLRRWVALASQPWGLDHEGILAVKGSLLLIALVLFILGNFTGLFGPFFGLFILALAYWVPDLAVSQLAARRQQQIGVELPDFLDTLAASLGAGVGLEPALRTLSERLSGPLADEMSRLVSELDLGETRENAFRHLLERTECKPLEMLIQSLLQGAQLGVPVATTFVNQARDLRSHRIYTAKEQAAKAAPKVTLLTTFLVTPAVLFFILGLVVLNLIYNPGAFGLKDIKF